MLLSVGLCWHLTYPLGGDDPYFHIGIARDYYEQRGLRFSSRVAEGALAHHEADREPLFHVFIAGLLYLGVPEFKAGMIASALGVGALAGAVYYFSRSIVISICALLSSSAFFYRLLVVRPQCWAIAFVVIGCVFLIQRKDVHAAVCNLVYSLSYSVPVLLLVAAVLRAMLSRDLRGLGWIAGSSAIGLVVHPHFPNNIAIMWYQGPQVVMNAVAGNPANVPMPTELLPWELSGFIVVFWLSMLMMVGALFVRSVPLWFHVLTVMLLVFALRIGRLYEYLVPLTFLHARPAVEYWTCGAPRLLRLLTWTVLILSTVVPTLATIDVQQQYPEYKSSAEWLSTNARTARVFNSRWDAYPQLFFYGKELVFTQGQDPMFVAAYDRNRFLLITKAREGMMSHAEFLNAFPVDYIVCHRSDGISRLAETDNVPVVFYDGPIRVLKVR